MFMNNKNDFIVFSEQEFESNNKPTNIEENKQNFIQQNINNILSDNKIEKERVLCIGKVQSGKTRNIIELINKSDELGYDLVLFFGGTNKLLKNQSASRLRQDLTSNNFFDFSSSWISNLGVLLNSNKKVVLTVMKINKDLDDIYKAIKNLDLTNKKIMIIDDECDYGSINTKSDSSPSEIHKKIELIFERIHKGKLISFTATPFANILNSKNIDKDNFSKTKIVVLQNSDQYWGLSEFNKIQDKTYLSLFEDNDKASYDIDSILVTLFVHILFIIKKSINENIDISSFKSQCLINIDSNTLVHEVVKDSVYKSLEFIAKGYKLFDFLIKITNRLNAEEFKSINNVTFENLYRQKMIQIAKEYLINWNKSIIVLNKENKNDDLSELDYNHQIIIGGVLLSRGVTYENLSTELLLNYPKDMIAIDTLLQRCRWFGYRSQNSKYMHIIMTNKLKKVFQIAEKYINIFKPGIMDFNEVKTEIEKLDLLHRRDKVRGTSYDKSR